MKPGDLVQINSNITTYHGSTGLILEIFPNGIVKNLAQQTLVKVLWSDGHQTTEFMEDLKLEYKVIQ